MIMFGEGPANLRTNLQADLQADIQADPQAAQSEVIAKFYQ